MACGCSSPSGPSVTTHTSSTGGPGCPLPRRTANPPTVPVIWAGADRLIPKSEIRIMGTQCNSEVVVGDSAVSGWWYFDAGTGLSSVQDPSITSVKDTFACATNPVYGLPAYGAAPGCRAEDENPDREVAFIRPGTSSSGALYAHQKSCCAVANTYPEMTPVEVSPDDFPTDTDDLNTLLPDIWYLTCKVTEGQNCNPKQFQWYWSKGTFTATASSITDFEDLPARTWTDDDNEVFGLAVWVAQPGGNWILQRIPDEDFQAYISKFVYRSSYLNPRSVLCSLPSPSTYNFTFYIDLTAQPNYSVDATEVQLYIESNLVSPASGGEGWVLDILINGVRKYRSTGIPSTIGNTDSGEIHVPIPANKRLQIDYVKTTVVVGTNYNYPASNAEVSLEAFK